MRKSKGRNGKLIPNSLRIISSCIRTVSTNASTVVRSAGASVAAITSVADDCREQVLWAGFDKLEISPCCFRRVLLLGYLKGFQVFDVEEASGLNEVVSRRTGPVTFLQMLPAPGNCDGAEKYKSLHPLLVVVGGDEDERMPQNNGHGPLGYGSSDSSFGSLFNPPTAVRFYSMKSNEYVKVIEFRYPVLMVRCSPGVVAIGLEEQIYCFDAATLEKKFTVITYPVHRVGDEVSVAVNRGYGPMAVGPRWLAYSPMRPFSSNTGRVSPKSLSSSISPSTSPGNGTGMARYAVESSKNLAAGILTLGDLGYKKLSKYCPDLLSDGASSPGWKTGTLASSEPDNSGFVSVKDLVSSEVISQFRAHTSPIAALCFDPSGTLLVTASVHGNNVNVFRVMPSRTCSGSGCNDWNTSHVHLYKIYRGITTAVIQDICFSHDSRWIGIVSSKGTCHIFVMSPFGGNDAFKALQTIGKRTPLFLSSAPPWWSSSSFTISDQNSSPPPPCTLSVVNRIKCSDSGLLNSVSNAAASVVGKTWVPSGAVAAIFHNSNPTGSLDAHRTATSLENVLVYSPSGFVVQHKIQSPMGLELIKGRNESWSAPQVNPQNEELRVKVEPIQWWDVCRRLDNSEREDHISGSFFEGRNDPEIDGDSKTIPKENVSSVDQKLVKDDSMKAQEKSHWYLSNAEVQINSYRIPLWKMSKLQFHVMEPPKAECYRGGEFEIEMTPSHEVEIRHKDLFPVFNHYPRAKSGWIDGDVPSTEDRHSSDSSPAREKMNEASVMCHSKPPSFSSTESSEGGTEKTAADFGLFFKEGYCNKPAIDEHHKSTEVSTDEVDAGGNNTHEKKNDDEDGWVGGVFEFSEEG